MQTIAIGNQKGGVGKTAVTHALGVVLAEAGHRVLLVDVDPQASLTGSFGAGEQALTLADVLGGATSGRFDLKHIIVGPQDGLHLAPADISLSATELGLVSRMGRENVLKRALAAVADFYDVVLIDCPPSLGLLTVNALTAANGVLVPTQPQIVDLRGLKLFLDTIEQIKRELNPGLELIGIVPTFYDGRLLHHQEAIEAMSAADLLLLSTRIGRSVRVAEAAAAGQSVVTYAADNPQATAFHELGKEISRWLNERQ